jgi:Na+/H+-translocating membrane pyrophosphatase
MTFGTAVLFIVFSLLFPLAVTAWLPPLQAVILVLALAVAAAMGGIFGVAVCAAGLLALAAAFRLWTRRVRS